MLHVLWGGVYWASGVVLWYLKACQVLWESVGRRVALVLTGVEVHAVGFKPLT